MESLWFILLILIAGIAVLSIPAIIITLAIVMVRASGSTIARVTLWIARAWLVIAIIGVVATVANGVAGHLAHLALPLEPYDPKLPLDGGGQLAVTNMDSVTADISGLSVGAKVSWILGRALYWLVPGAVALLVATTCKQMLKGRAFAPQVSRLVMITAVIVLVGGSAASVLTDMAGGLAAQEIARQIDENATSGHEWPHSAFGVSLPVWPIGAGLVLAVLAALFRYGADLERDSDGLI